MAAINWVTVSWVATASSNRVESRARRVLPFNTPVASITERTASKTRSGRSDFRNLVSPISRTEKSNPSSSTTNPQATFQLIRSRRARAASRWRGPREPGAP